MTKIDIFSGFLGAGKTTLIRKLISEAFKGEKLVLIENEFGKIAIDGGFLQDAGIEITEMSQGCICCSLVGDFGKALRQVLETYHPDRILIEPSGVGKLSDVIRAVQNLHMEDVTLNSFTTVADANKCKMYMKNFGEFYNDQIEHANSIILSRTDGIKPEKLEACVALLREHNQNATIITTPWDQLTGAQILETMEHKNTLEEELKLLAEETEHEHHHHHDHDHDEHDEHCTCGCHDHDHDHDEHDHDHHHHHHADEVFTSWAPRDPQVHEDEIEHILEELDNSEKYGMILRAKASSQAGTASGSTSTTCRRRPLCATAAPVSSAAVRHRFSHQRGRDRSAVRVMRAEPYRKAEYGWMICRFTCLRAFSNQARPLL